MAIPNLWVVCTCRVFNCLRLFYKLLMDVVYIVHFLATLRAYQNPCFEAFGVSVDMS